MGGSYQPSKIQFLFLQLPLDKKFGAQILSWPVSYQTGAFLLPSGRGIAYQEGGGLLPNGRLGPAERPKELCLLPNGREASISH